MMSEWTLVLSSFVEITLEYYRNILLLIILKKTFPFNFMALSVRSNVLVTKISTNVRYLHNYLP